jgi:ADP-ribosylglycohydrolase
MLHEQPWIKYADSLDIELLQCRDEGKNTEGLKEQIEHIKCMQDGAEEKAAELFDGMMNVSVESDFIYEEPSDYEGIKSASAASCLTFSNTLAEEDYYDKVYGAWLGKCAGCLLGQPVEGYLREKILGILNSTGNLPVTHYISSDIDEKARKKYEITDVGGPYGAEKHGWINNVDCMPEDDDINYTLIALKLLQKYGTDFTPEDVLECWLEKLPYLHTCTAERVAYRNAASAMLPPKTAEFRNPYREYIGAQIRADFYGYIYPGEPQKAAEMAFRDACISHTKNGIYGAMFVASMISAAACCPDIEKIIETGLSVIPPKSRYAAAVEKVILWNNCGKSAEEMIGLIHSEFDEAEEYYWCHVLPNAKIVCVSLLCGGGELQKTIGTALSAAFDTDCNCATAGSVIGMMLGEGALPEKWTGPLHDRIITGVDGIGTIKISQAARDTVEIGKQIKER